MNSRGAHFIRVIRAIRGKFLVKNSLENQGLSRFSKRETALKQEPDVLILRMRKVLAMDATGLNALEDLYERLRRHNKQLVLSGPHTQPLFMMDKAGFLDKLGRENVCANIDLALARSREILKLPPANLASGAPARN
jgi:sulfate permease, SulP family